MATRGRIGDIVYQRPNFTIQVAKRRKLIERLDKEPNDLTIRLYDQWNVMRDEWDYYGTVVSIGTSAYLRDTFWESEMDHWVTFSSEISGLDSQILERFLKRGRIGHLKKYVGPLVIKRLKSSIVNAEKAALEISEWRSIQEWNDFKTQIKVKFGSKYHDTDALFKMLSSRHRKERKQAYDALTLHFSHEKLDQIMDRLVHVRDEIAKSTNFSNYEALSESESFRDWGSAEAYSFKESIRKYIVPIVHKGQVAAKKRRLGIKKIENYDEHVFWKSGNPEMVVRHSGMKKAFLESIHALYGDVGYELADAMISRGLMDIDRRKGKESGASCWLIDGTNDSYILAQLHGEYDDPYTIFHEFGHALNFKLSGDHHIPELRKASREMVEIPSMSSEFLANHVLENFYGPHSDRIRGQHLMESLMLMCRVCVNDEWQRNLYRNPFWTKKERDKCWASAEKTWAPWRTPTPDGWKSDWGVFETPFYDLDYAIAAVCSIELWEESLDDMQSATDKILRLCELGGTLPFKDAIKKVGIRDPFDPKSVKLIAKFAKEQLEKFGIL